MNDTNDNNNIYKNNDGESKTKLSFHLRMVVYIQTHTQFLIWGFHYFAFELLNCLYCVGAKQTVEQKNFMAVDFTSTQETEKER